MWTVLPRPHSDMSSLFRPWFDLEDGDDLAILGGYYQHVAVPHKRDMGDQLALRRYEFEDEGGMG